MTRLAPRTLDLPLLEAGVFAGLAASIGVWAACLPAAADGIGNENAPAWETCALCHGLDGNSAMSKFPKLAGQPASYIAKQLHDFRSGARDNDGGQMEAIVTEINEEQIGQVAEYFSRLQRSAGKGGAETTSKRAEALFVNGDPAANIAACGSCHSHQSGNALSGIGPHLNGQHEDYLAKQLRDFRSGERKNDTTGTMQAIASALSVAEIDELAAYLSGLPPGPPSAAQ